MNILITGGAGYIGSVVAEELLKKGHQAIIVDSLVHGHKDSILPNSKLFLVDICDTSSLDIVFDECKIEAVMHLAGESIVAQSASDPKIFFQNNIVGGINLLNSMLKHNVKRIIFSSSAAVYGEPRRIPLEESDPKIPVNAYGDSKLMFENILAWYGKAYEIKYVSLRYFNAAGATERLGEDHHPETHLIPNILKTALSGNSSITIFGNDYPTHDGSCIRDYVHVEDIGHAHVLALEKLETLSGSAYNLGNQQGYSVFEVVNKAREITGADIKIILSSRRPGDPAVLIANSILACKDLGWEPKLSKLDNILNTAWIWIQKHPNGYIS
jgi:UDP-glucose 4-epimerase